jgi:hypothetical protein
MPDNQKIALQQTIMRMPPQKQEQYIGELVAKAKLREGMTQQQRHQEDEEMRELTESFQAILETMDPMQK